MAEKIPLFTETLETLPEELAAGSTFAGRMYELMEEKGEREKAAEQYRLFLDLWKDADVGLPEPADVKKRLAGLPPRTTWKP